MAVRVFAEDVKVILSTTLTNPQIEKFIETASALIDTNLDVDAFDYTVAELTEIELYLSAHFCSLRDQRAKSEKVDVISLAYQGVTGMGLDATHYGQTAKILDRHGVLAKLGKRSAPSIFAVPSWDD